MKLFRVCMQNIRKWNSNNRIKIIFLLAIMCVAIYTDGIGTLSDNMGIKVSPWIYPFLFSYRYMKIVFIIPILFIFCDAPFIDDNQIYIMLRVKRKVWCVGQILYICVTSVIYSLVLMVSSVIVNINHITFSSNWGEVLGTAGTTNAMSQFNLQYNTIKISGRIITYYTPAQAMFFSFILMTLSFIFIGMIIYVVNVITKSSIVGSICAAVFILLTAVVDGFPYLMWLSPISCNSINNIDVAGQTLYPTIQYVLSVYSIVIAACIIIALITSRRQEIVVRKER